MQNLHLILTVDYEVFGNGSGCVNKCVLEPAERMMRVAEPYGAPVTFFVEALEFQAMSVTKEFSEFSTKVSDQIRLAVQNGHDAQLHLHPQWTNAKLDENSTWMLDMSRWRIGDLKASEVHDLLCGGKAWLESICYPVSSTYRCLAFRAGGWCIQPSDFVINGLIALGFKIDSTVAPGFHTSARGEWRDFRNSPDLPYWSVLNDVCRNESSGLTEIPITTGEIGLRRHLKTILSLSTNGKSSGLAPGCKGNYTAPDGRWGRIRGKLCKLMHLGQVMLDFSTMPADILIHVTRQWNSRFNNLSYPLPIVAIAHTKNFTSASESALRDYLIWAKNEGVVFSTFQHWLDDTNKSGRITPTNFPNSLVSIMESSCNP